MDEQIVIFRKKRSHVRMRGIVPDVPQSPVCVSRTQHHAELRW
jgi:hypothetical protein